MCIEFVHNYGDPDYCLLRSLHRNITLIYREKFCYSMGALVRTIVHRFCDVQKIKRFISKPRNVDFSLFSN